MRILLCLLLMTGVAFAQVDQLNDQEITKLRQVIARIPTLKALADNLGSETIPLDLQILRQERLDIISQRDAEVVQARNAAQATIGTINTNYEVLIDAKENEISSKQTELNNLIP